MFELLKTLLDAAMVLLRYPLHFGNYTFSMFGVMMVSFGATLVGIVLKAIFGDD